MATIKEVFAENLRAVRTAKGLTQKGLADASGFTQPYLSGLERSQRDPTLEAAGRIADALGVSILRLLRPVKAEPIQPADFPSV